MTGQGASVGARPHQLGRPLIAYGFPARSGEGPAPRLSEIKRGARNPSWEAIARLAKGMGVGVAEIAADYDRRSN